MFKIVGLLVAAVMAIYAIQALGQIRADARAAPTPIGNSSSNGTSFAWFYDHTERTVFVCRIAQAATDTVDCKAKTTLP